MVSVSRRSISVGSLIFLVVMLVAVFTTTGEQNAFAQGAMFGIVGLAAGFAYSTAPEPSLFRRGGPLGPGLAKKSQAVSYGPPARGAF